MIQREKNVNDGECLPLKSMTAVLVCILIQVSNETEPMSLECLPGYYSPDGCLTCRQTLDMMYSNKYSTRTLLAIAASLKASF